MKNSSTGIIVWRMNPPHIWHWELIRKSLKENSITLVCIGTKGVRDEKNPFSLDQIKKWISSIFLNESKKISIVELPDNPSDFQWTINFQKQLEDMKIGKDIVFYWWDLKNDYAITCIHEYMKEWEKYNISFKERDRKKTKVHINGHDIDISATNVRLALKEKNNDIVDKMVDKKITQDLLLEYNKWV